MPRKKHETGGHAQGEPRTYRFQFPPKGVPWYVEKSGKIEAASRAVAIRELVKKGVLEPFEARVAEIELAE